MRFCVLYWIPFCLVNLVKIPPLFHATTPNSIYFCSFSYSVVFLHFFFYPWTIHLFFLFLSCWLLQKLLSVVLVPGLVGPHLISCNYRAGPSLQYVVSGEKKKHWYRTKTWNMSCRLKQKNSLTETILKSSLYKNQETLLRNETAIYCIYTY